MKKPRLLGSHRGLSNYPSVSDQKSFSRSRRLSPCVVQSGDILKWCGQIRLQGSESFAFCRTPEHPCGIQLPQIHLCWWQIRPADSETSDPCPLPKSFPVLVASWHPFAILEDSTLRRDWNFDMCLHQASLIIQPVDLKLWVLLCFSTQSDCSQRMNL